MAAESVVAESGDKSLFDLGESNHMFLRTTSTRVLATAGVAALAAGTVLVGTTTSAEAAPATTQYTCQYEALGLGPWAVTVDTEILGLDQIPTISAGTDVPGGFATITNHFTIPADAHDTLASFNVEDVSFPDFAGTFGTNPVGVADMAATVSGMTDNGDGTWGFDANGLNAAFEVPAAGTYDLHSPEAFGMVASVPNVGNVAVPCVLTTGTEAGVLGTVDVTKNASTTAATVVKPPVEKGTKGKVKVTVATDNATQGASGKVVAKKGSKTIGSGTLNDAGKVTITLDKLPVGKNKVTLNYKGDAYTAKSSKTITVKVVK